MKHLLTTFVVLMSLCIAIPAWSAEETAYNRISLSASASREIDNDTMTANLFAQEQGSNTAAMANSVNQAISWAVAEAKEHPQIKVSTDAYSTSPIYRNSTITGWRVRQSIRLESQDMALMSELIGSLQSQLKLGGIGFTVSREKRKMLEDELISEALGAFKGRAELISREMGKTAYKVVNINVGTSGARPVYMARSMKMEAMAMADSVAAPTVEAGEATMSVQVNGSIELQ